MAGEGKPVHGGYHVKVEGVPGADALLFYSATSPSGTLEMPDFKTWDAQNNPVNSLAAGQQIQWAPITLSRGVDDDKALYEWFKKVAEEGAESAKEEIKISVFDSESNPLHTWNLQGAVITQYEHSALNAQTNEVLVNTVQIKYEDATLE